MKYVAFIKEYVKQNIIFSVSVCVQTLLEGKQQHLQMFVNVPFLFLPQLEDVKSPL